ncbi:MAG: ABC transporter permease [Arachidicoccus sp.]|nr:ABC transporter permease [Arachidicoccus sp.]
MTNNYFKSAWRNLRRNKTFSVLNIAGLAVGIACASLIFLWVEYNVTYNHSIPDLNNIYQVRNNQTYGKDTVSFPVSSVLVKDALLQEFPGVKNVARYQATSGTVTLDDKHLAQSGAYADFAFLKMFDLPLAQGSPAVALKDISQIAISQKLAKSYFGNTDAMGKTLVVDNYPYKVYAVYKDIPQNVRFFGVDFLLPFQVYFNKYKDQGMNSWGSNWAGAWVQLNPNTNVTAFNAKFRKLIHQKDPQVTNQSLWLYPLKKLQLYGEFVNGKEDTSKGNIQYVKMFSLVALIILIIACINFMNLSTARSEKRAKEIGMRKVLGSTRRDLVGRLLSESLIVAYVAVVLAVLIVACVLPLFSSLINVHLQLHLWHPSHVLFLIIIGGICGFVAGSYPALYLSSFNPVRALKNQITKNAGNASIIRKGLVVIQFTISVIIIFAVIVIYRQIQFTKNRDLGFSKDNVLYVNTTPDLIKSFPSLKQNILSTNNVNAVSLGSHSPMAMYANGGGYNWEGKSAAEDVLVTNVSADADYLTTFGIQLKEGRGFSQDSKVDSTNVLINESFAKIMGKAGHVGGQFYWDDPKHPMTIIGITKNFVYNDVNATHPGPLAFYNLPSNANYIFMKLKPTQDLQGVISKLQTIFRNLDASQSFDYHFVDKDFEKKFKQQQFIGSLATIFGALAIFISCLGLLGLSAFMAEQRKKEIGIRKVLGASVVSIIKLLSKDFLKLVLLSYVIAFPLAYWMMHNWLQGYEYRVSIGWYIFVVAALLAIIIAFITVSSQALRAAKANPVNNLKTE